MIRIALGLGTLWLAGCSTKVVYDSGLLGDETGEQETGAPDSGESADTTPVDTGPTDEELDAIWGDTQLVITSPHSGDFLPLGVLSPFQAEILDADGNPMDFDDIQWSSSIDSDWAPTGKDFEDTLSVGTHDITATAELPNGDRLAYTVGGVLVQSEDTGIYAGSVQIDVTVEYGGTPYTVSCIGATTITVNQEGDNATGTSTCTISLFGYDTDANQDIDLDVASGGLSGEVALDLSLFSYGFDASGSVADGELSATWSDDVYGYASVEGTLEATRLTRYVE